MVVHSFVHRYVAGYRLVTAFPSTASTFISVPHLRQEPGLKPCRKIALSQSSIALYMQQAPAQIAPSPTPLPRLAHVSVARSQLSRLVHLSIGVFLQKYRRRSDWRGTRDMRNLCALSLLSLAIIPSSVAITDDSAPPSSVAELPTFVIVGGGFKGAFIAANLVRPDRNRVLLLEKTDVLVRLTLRLARCESSYERLAM